MTRMTRKTRMARMARTVARMAPWLADLADPFHFRFQSVVEQEHLTILFCINPSLNSSPALL